MLSIFPVKIIKEFPENITVADGSIGFYVSGYELNILNQFNIFLKLILFIHMF